MISLLTFSRMIQQTAYHDAPQCTQMKHLFQYSFSKNQKTLANLLTNKGFDFVIVPQAGLEPARPQWSRDFKSRVSTNSTTRANLNKNPSLEGFLSGRRDSNPRPRPWQGRALPAELLSHCANFAIRLLKRTSLLAFGTANII